MNNLILEITESFESGINVFDTANAGARHFRLPEFPTRTVFFGIGLSTPASPISSMKEGKP
jgi:hypothetical protein